MPETKTLNTITTTSRVGSAIEIYTYYQQEVINNILSVFISDEVGNLSGTSYIEGEGIIQFIPQVGFSFFLQSDGSFVIDSDNSANYSIDAQTGTLFYTD